MVKLGRFLSRLLGSLIKAVLPLIGNVLEPLAKSVLVPLGLTAAAAAIQKNFVLDQARQH